MIERKLRSVLKKSREEFPCLVVTGPRQSGKTTLLRDFGGDSYGYITFDDPLERQFAETDPRGFLRRFQSRPVILDEIQYSPGLLPYIKMAIDTDRTPGRFLMTGSQQFDVMRQPGRESGWPDRNS
jgi:predicted AAA+ superfamily ATPase